MKGATRLKLTIAYDGAPFRGWQSQAGGGTVQDHLEQAFMALCGERVPVHGAGRTDAGVHALAQCAHADVTRQLASWPRALNAHLPPQIRVVKCVSAAADFHARFSAQGKVYRYRLWTGETHSPFELGRSWHLPGPLDEELLAAAAERLTGTHDYAGFAASRGKPETNTRRTVSRIQIRRVGPLLTLTFFGDGFLYKMVRLLTGSMLRCAQGRAGSEWLERVLARKAKSCFAAPAEGLYLVRVLY
jgi:tRNA pseudouridine38-40 synthase